MVAGAHEAALLCTPEAKAHPCAGSRRPLRKLQPGLEHGGGTAAIVIDARPLRYAVEVCANDDQGTSATGGHVSEHVPGQTFARHGVDGETHLGAAIGPGCDVEGATKLVGDTDHRNGNDLI